VRPTLDPFASCVDRRRSWCTHSGYALIAPLHWLALKWYRVDIPSLLDRLHSAISDHCATRAAAPTWAASEDELAGKRADVKDRVALADLWPAYLRMICVVTVCITVPALAWYCAVPLTSMTDITCLYNSVRSLARIYNSGPRRRDITERLLGLPADRLPPADRGP
jgi:hypothetical protein